MPLLPSWLTSNVPRIANPFKSPAPRRPRIAPEHAEKAAAVLARLQGAMRDARADYTAGKASRYQRAREGILSSGAGADYHQRNEVEAMKRVELARDMDRNDTVLGPMADRLITNVIGTGFKIEPATGLKELDDAYTKEHEQWSNDPQQCDVARDRNFHEIEKALFRSAAVIDGDGFVIPRRSGQLQVMEYHRCRTHGRQKDIVLGVELDNQRRPVRYHFTRDNIDPNRQITSQHDIEPVDAYGPDGTEWVWHIKDPKRTDQTRGVTPLTSVFDALGFFEDLSFAKLVQAQAASAFTFFIKTSETGGNFGVKAYGQKETTTNADGTERLLQMLAPGSGIRLDPGEDVEPFSPNIPNTEFFEHATLTLQLIGACINMPLLVYLLEARATNFSGWRGAIDQAKRGWQEQQGWFAGRFHRRVWNWRVRQMNAKSRALRALANRVEDPRKHVIHYPGWPYIEPSKEAVADERQIKSRLQSRRRILAKRGLQHADIAREAVEDNAREIKLAHEVATELSAELGVEIDPTQVLEIDTKRPFEVSETLDAVRTSLEAYEVGVRSGAITPQPADEEHYRSRLGLPAMQPQPALPENSSGEANTDAA